MWDARGCDRTALMMASKRESKGHEIVSLLLDKGDDATARDHKGE